MAHPANATSPAHRDKDLFRPPWWLRSGHAQTIWPFITRRPPPLRLETEQLRLADGDVLRLAWGPRADGPVVLVLHGLGGCARSPYVLGLLRRVHAAGMQGVVMEFRGAGGVPNRLPRFFHAGETGDPAATVAHLRARLPGRPITLVGFSMGGIVGLNYLAQHADNCPVTAAVAISAPLDLASCARALNRGTARVYQWELVRGLKRLVAQKHAAGHRGLDMATVRRVHTLWDFDHLVTGPMHGFDGAEDYYARCSPGPRLGEIRTPTLLLQSLDDPFVPASTLPPVHHLPPAVTGEYHPGGGHVGFVTGSHPLRPRYWLETRVLEFLRGRLPGY